MSNRSCTLYHDRHLISLGWLPPREAKVLRVDLEKARQERNAEGMRVRGELLPKLDRLNADCAAMIKVIELAAIHDHSDGDETDCVLCDAVKSVLDKPNPGQHLLDDLDNAHQEAQKLRGDVAEIIDVIAWASEHIESVCSPNRENGLIWAVSWRGNNFTYDKELYGCLHKAWIASTKSTATPLLEGDK
jgi:hypothetical protein